MSDINSAELDRYITGNYGEDRLKGLVQCSECGYWMREEDSCSQEDCPFPLTEPDPDERRDERREQAW